MKQYWSAPELWPGSLVVIIAGGPSLTAAQVDACRDREWNGRRVRAIAINDGYRLASWADVLYFCDDKWWQWHAKQLAGWQGIIARLAGGAHDFGDPRIKVLRNVGRSGLCAERDGLMNGKNSGYQAINLAVHLGAKRIVLLGYDMQAPVVCGKLKTHWFGDHPGGTSPGVYREMLPWFDTLVGPLKQHGVDILNATPGSELRTFPRRALEEGLAEEANARAVA